ncbi:ABC transporter permease [Paenibacillus radicis (ex Xue et al. 2023)]|uniref:ABC transporter permease n=1 Tax=Paenibacillus radicis (ex Xue et al. 2023) TaxID=2972489 RepID=A0ABT1YH74_9BACL|nr:ABC transporter permease [Paenibacillus radicis (ex Xue et al. 2023)]MCR8632551.1 ABC transporter permease [Paenibacillus radicis (ex Xue et al. 2023)]
MNAYVQLTLAQLRIFIRNRQVLFWTLLFPVFFMVMLGSFLGNGNSVSLEGVVIDQDQTTQSQTISGLMKSSAIVKATESQDAEQALAQLKQGDTQFVLIIPKGTGQTIQSGIKSGAPAELKMYYDETNLSVSELAKVALNQIIDSVSKQSVNYTPVLSLKSEGVQSLKLRYIDFLVPGILAMMIMSNNLNGVAGQIASWRERGVLRRMQSTTLRASTFIAAQITARLVLNGIQSVIVLLVAYLFFGTQVNGSWLTLLFFVVLGTLAFMATGFIVAGIAKTPESAGPIAGFISFPMLFVGGVFFPIKNMPEFLQGAVKLIPISHLTVALRQVMNVGTAMSGLWVEAAFLGGWLVLAFIAASLTFKWE